jgi:Myb-like DNA-binding domain
MQPLPINYDKSPCYMPYANGMCLTSMYSSLLMKRPTPDDTPHMPANPLSGRWTKEEKQLFEYAYSIYGRQWGLINKLITTRTIEQIRTHALKYKYKDNQHIYVSQDRDDLSKSSGCESEENAPNDKINIVEQYSSALDRAYQEVKSNIRAFISFIHQNVGFSKVNSMIDMIVEGNKKLKMTADQLRPLPPVSLKNLAMLNNDIEKILDWYSEMDTRHRDYKKNCKFFYSLCGYEIIDLSSFSFFSLIRRKPKVFRVNKLNGFVPFKKVAKQ